MQEPQLQSQTVYSYDHFILLTTIIVFPVLLAADLPNGGGHKLISLVPFMKPSPPYPIHKPWGIDNGVVTDGLRDSTLSLVTFQTQWVLVKAVKVN